MARELSAVTTMSAEAVAVAPLHVGSASTSTGQDVPLVRDVAGRLVVPGSSITGALRAALGERESRGELWGAAAEAGLGASRVVVHDGEVLGRDGELITGRRDGVGIDRALGSAVDGLLYARETLPAGTRIALRIEVHSTVATELGDGELLFGIRALLRGPGLRLGARSSRGMGLVQVPRKGRVRIEQVRYDSPQAYWRSRRAPVPVELAGSVTPPPDQVQISVAWRPRGALAVMGTKRDTTIPRLPLMEPDPAQPDRVRQVLPGTSIAGALRSRAELICRTVRRTPTPDGLVAQLASTPLVVALFGGASGAGDATASPLTVPDCVSETSVAVADWLRFLGPNPPRRVAASGKGAELRLTDHVSVDRWTGGAADGRLFSDVEPHGFVFPPLRMSLRRDQLPEPLRDAAVALLVLTLREFSQGRVPLGADTHRGHGDVVVGAVTVTGLGDAVIGDLDLLGESWSELRAAWRAWIDTAPEMAS